MKIIPNCDLFIDKQPKKEFEKLLSSPLHADKPVNFQNRQPKRDEIAITCLNPVFNYPDENNLLAFCYKDFLRFLDCINITVSENGTPLFFKEIQGLDEEEFRLEISNENILVLASNTKGVRYALIYIEDLITRANAPVLPIKTINKKPYIKTRISRCFFTPPSHASSDGSTNELTSYIDYYPEEYLNRLAHQGINGLWIGSSFKAMLKSEIFDGYGKEELTQTKKLNQIIDKCKKFGIDIYLFCVEPTAYPELERYSDCVSYNGGARYLCPSKQKVKDYIKESVTRLFTLVPNLGGLINITVGEEFTACSSAPELTCPECKKVYGDLGNALAQTEKTFALAMKQVAPKAKFISWTYAQRESNFSDVDDTCYARDESVIHMQNFEDFGWPVQLGKKRIALDYWLSYRGPGELTKRTTRISKKHKIEHFAKIQACSSHEISTIPYVPVPGILYDKYKYLYKNDFSGVLLCWYFGNYPSIMNKAASLLSYKPFYKSKKAFLTELAKTYCPDYYAELVNAWLEFEKGYENFPVNVAFEWFGPMQDSPCEPLFLKPKDWPLSATWLKSDQAGDRIGECLLNGHDIDEAIILVEKMCKHWKKGVMYFERIKHGFDPSFIEQVTTAKAIGLIFESGYDALKFYKLRHELGTGCINQLSVLSQMKDIVKNEIKISSLLIPLCKEDIRIGYHSEANGYKIFAEKLFWRINELEKLLSTDFVEVENNILQNKKPLPFYYGENEGYSKVLINQPKWVNFKFENGQINQAVKLKATEKNGVISIVICTKSYNDTFTIKPEFKVLFPKIPLHIENQTLTVKAMLDYSVPSSLTKRELAKFKFDKKIIDDVIYYTVTFTRKTFNMKPNEPFRLAITCKNEKGISMLSPATEYFEPRLIRGALAPCNYCFFLNE